MVHELLCIKPVSLIGIVSSQPPLVERIKQQIWTFPTANQYSTADPSRLVEVSSMEHLFTFPLQTSVVLITVQQVSACVDQESFLTECSNAGYPVYHIVLSILGNGDLQMKQDPHTPILDGTLGMWNVLSCLFLRLQCEAQEGILSE